ncbi:hypothetical protein [Spirosoma pulveris]
MMPVDRKLTNEPKSPPVGAASLAPVTRLTSPKLTNEPGNLVARNSP